MELSDIKILFIDDEEKIISRVSKILKSAGYTVDTAPDGDKAISLLKSVRYDIVLTDLNMPNKTGFEVIEYMREQDLKALPIILTGYASVEGAIQAIKLGAYDFIEKPVDSASLKLSIQRAAERITLEREISKNMKELKKLNDLKDEFLTVVSHDLRSPLATIGGYINYLLKKEKLSETQRRYILIIKDIANNLYTLVNELLDISKIETGIIMLNQQQVDIVELANTSINNFILLAIDKNNSIEFYNELDETIINIDSIKILQVINNLVSNAIKFTENGKIIVRASSKDSDIIISVEDTGIGIKKKEFAKLFDKYSYYHRDGTRGEQGTGLGLVICQKFIELHGGELTVSSKPGKGSIFEFNIPRVN